GDAGDLVRAVEPRRCGRVAGGPLRLVILPVTLRVGAGRTGWWRRRAGARDGGGGRARGAVLVRDRDGHGEGAVGAVEVRRRDGTGLRGRGASGGHAAITPIDFVRPEVVDRAGVRERGGHIAR